MATPKHWNIPVIVRESYRTNEPRCPKSKWYSWMVGMESPDPEAVHVLFLCGDYGDYSPQETQK